MPQGKYEVEWCLFLRFAKHAYAPRTRNKESPCGRIGLQLIRRDKHLVRSTQHLRAEQGIMGNTRIGQRSLLLSDTTTLPSSSSSAHLCPPVSTDLCSNFAVQARTPAPHDGTIEAARIRIQSQDLRAHLVILNRQRLQALW